MTVFAANFLASCLVKRPRGTLASRPAVRAVAKARHLVASECASPTEEANQMNSSAIPYALLMRDPHDRFV